MQRKKTNADGLGSTVVGDDLQKDHLACVLRLHDGQQELFHKRENERKRKKESSQSVTKRTASPADTTATAAVCPRVGTAAGPHAVLQGPETAAAAGAAAAATSGAARETVR